MDISKLLPYIKQAAALVVTPEEVAQQLNKQENAKKEDKQRETIDNDVIDQDKNHLAENDNEEGQMLSNSFVELEVEEAIVKAKEEKLLNSNKDTVSVAPKLGTCFDALADRMNHKIHNPSFWDSLRVRFK